MFSASQTSRNSLSVQIFPMICKQCGGEIKNHRCLYCGTSYKVVTSAPKHDVARVPELVHSQPKITPVSNGKSMVVRKHTWVTNINKTRSGNVSRDPGDSGSLMVGGSIRIIGKGTGLFLLEYVTPHNSRAYGAPHPSGTLFYATPELLCEITQQSWDDIVASETFSLFSLLKPFIS